ncbi:MAG: hypothetical protein SVK08_01990 [Halobacteriota archaeon]|nr:hypothetical protein [Halobacteriota archaeon]
MEIINIYPKELHIKLELSESELNCLLDFLNNCEAKLDLKDEEQRKAHDFVVKEFFPGLDKLSEEIKRMR